MFAQFALVIAATAFISAVNAATLKPTQCAMWLRTPVPPDQRFFLYASSTISTIRVSAATPPSSAEWSATVASWSSSR
jgi:HAE1 family hydrophobic/amphiphilic exporter-1